MYINTAEQISGIPASWPGYDLKIGATGDKVRQLQEQLDAISSVYTAIPDISPDGIYGPRQQSGNFSRSSDCRRPEWWTLPPGIRSPTFMWESPGSQSCHRLETGQDFAVNLYSGSAKSSAALVFTIEKVWRAPPLKKPRIFMDCRPFL